MSLFTRYLHRSMLSRDQRARIEAILLAFSLLALAIPVGHYPVRVGELGFIVTLPLYATGRTEFLRLKMILGSLTMLVFGLVLSIGLGHGTIVDSVVRRYTLISVLTVITVAMMLSLGSCILGLKATAVLVGISLLVHPVAASSLAASNPWKYAYGWPVTLIVLALASDRGAKVRVLALAVLSIATVVFNYRSLLLILFLACCISTSKVIFSKIGHDWSGARVASFLVVACIGSICFFAGYQQLATTGQLGADIQEKTIEQRQTGGNPLVGGRPEIVAAFVLFSLHPLGFGPGVTPDGDDLSEAISKESSVTPVAGLGENSAFRIFSGGVVLHSIAADSWASFGPAGLVWSFGLLLSMFGGIRRVVAGDVGTAAPVAAFAMVYSIWDIGFSPLISNSLQLGVALGIVWFIFGSASLGERAAERAVVR